MTTPKLPLRICFLIDQLRTGGTETHLLRLIENLDPSIVLPHLCLLGGEGEASRRLEPNCCPVIRLGVTSLVSRRAIRQSFRFRRALLNWKIDILQVHFPDSTYFGVPLAKLAGVRRVVRTRRDLFYWVTPTHKRYGKFLDRIYNSLFVDRVITNCKACQVAACQSERISPSRVNILENGIQLESLLAVPTRRSHDDRHDPIHVGAVSMLRPEKRIDVFVKAAAILAKENQNLRFSVAGDGSQRADLERQISVDGLSERFSLPGVIEDVTSYLADLDVWVLCSESEGQSNALIEAMAAGRAVITTRVGGNVEVVDDEVNGLLVPPNDPSALAVAIKRLVDDGSLRIRLANRARETAIERFSLQAMIERHQQFYLEMCGGPDSNVGHTAVHSLVHQQ